MPTEKAIGNEQDAKMWSMALREAREKLAKVEVTKRRLYRAIRLMEKQIDEKAPWPTAPSEALNGQE